MSASTMAGICWRVPDRQPIPPSVVIRGLEVRILPRHRAHHRPIRTQEATHGPTCNLIGAKLVRQRCKRRPRSYVSDLSLRIETRQLIEPGT